MGNTKLFTQRIELLDACLRRRNKKWSFKELYATVVDHLEQQTGKTASKKTIHKDISYLIDQGAPIEVTKIGVQYFYRYTDANYSIKNLPLNDEEILVLKDAIEILTQFGGLSIVQDISAIVTKLEKVIATNLDERKPLIQFEKHTAAKGVEHLDNLLHAIREQTALTIHYQPFQKPEPFQWLFHPYLLKQYRHRWFLIGRIGDATRVTNLALDRIRLIKPSLAAFVPNDIFDPETFYHNLIGVTLPEGAMVEDIEANVAPNHANYIRTKPIHHTQAVVQEFENGGLKIRLRLINNYELRACLLSYGPDILITKPALLRNQIATAFHQGSKAYQVV